MEHPIKKYILFLKEDYKYNTKFDTANYSFEQADKIYSEHTVNLKAGTLLYSQDTTWTVEQIAEAKKDGFIYNWGFGPCITKSPFEKLIYGKVEFFQI